MKTYKVLAILILITGMVSCDVILENELDSLNPERTVYYWIMADADTYVECVMAGGACVPVEANYSGRPLVTANSRLGIKRSYIDFPLPDFPSGTEVEEAYVEMFHSGANEDGKTDDIEVGLTRVPVPWNANEIHYANQPVRNGVGGEFQIKLRSQAWSGSSDMAFTMNQVIRDPGNFHGFVAFIRNFEPGYEKGYYSNNDQSVIQDGLGRAPRLLMKVKLPEGVSAQDINFSERHVDINGSRFFGVRFRQGNAWPAEWDVAAYER